MPFCKVNPGIGSEPGGGNASSKVKFLFCVDYRRIEIVLIILIVYPVIYLVPFLGGHIVIQQGFHSGYPALFLLGIDVPVFHYLVELLEDIFNLRIVDAACAASREDCKSKDYEEKCRSVSAHSAKLWKNSEGCAGNPFRHTLVLCLSVTVILFWLLRKSFLQGLSRSCISRIPQCRLIW